MNRVFKTSIWNRYGYVLMVLACSFNAYSLEQLSAKIAWSLYAVVSMFLLFRYANNKIYMQIKDQIMTVNVGRKSDTFPISEIDHIKMNYHPIGDSYFQLKDGRKISFNPRALSDKEADSLKEVCPDVRG